MTIISGSVAVIELQKLLTVDQYLMMLTASNYFQRISYEISIIG